MPMSPRLLRPRATAALVATDSDARTYINAVRTADGGQYMEPAIQLAIDAFVKGCKDDGIWTALQACCILMGARTLSGALTPLVGTAPTNNGPFVSGDYDRETGLKGDGTGKYLDSGRAGNADGQNDFHAAVYVSAVSTLLTATTFIGNSTSATSGSTRFGPQTPSGGGSTRLVFAAVRQATSNIGLGPNPTPTGFHGVNRSGSGSFNYRVASGNNTVTQASQAPASANLFVFANSDAGTPISVFDGRMAFYSIGSALTLSLLDSRVNTLYTAIGAAI